MNNILIRSLYRPTFRFRRFLSTKPSQETNESQKVFPRRIFSGIQPTGSIHLGNYLGAISQWVKLQENNEDMILSIVDMHSITLPHVNLHLYPSRNTELFCRKRKYFRLAHLPTYKEKSVGVKDVSLGLYVYPVLQTADILAYKATHVPVGEDQAQHIQLAQDLARMFNNRYGADTFPIPHAITVGSEYARLKSLRDPSKKMSKSDPDQKSRICLTDDPSEIVKNIKKSVTDFISEVYYDPDNRPGVSNLISIHSFVTSKPIEEICSEAKGLDTGRYKLLVADAVVAHVEPIQKKITQYLNDPGYLLNILKDGTAKASAISNETVKEVRSKLGMDVGVKIEDKVKIQS